MKNERRNEDRYCFNLDLHPDGELYLLVDERTIEIWKLLDISPFGTCISINEKIHAGSTVTLQYHRNADVMLAFGTVAWSGPENTLEEGAGFRMGIEFNKDKMPLNAALFKTITAPITHLNQVAPEVQGRVSANL